MKPLSIIFFGPDASGKSTQVRLLISYLQGKGFRVRRVWIRAHHSFVFIILKFFFKINLDEDPFLKESNYGSVLIKSRIWLLMEVISVFPWILFRFCIPRLMGYVVICDRYIVDTLVSLAYTCNDFSLMYRFPAKILLGFIPSNVSLIHLTGSLSSLKSRSKEGDIVKNSIEFQKKHYTAFAYSLSAKTINTSLFDVNETFSIVLNYIENESLKKRIQKITL